MCLCGTCLYSAFSESYASSNLIPAIPMYIARALLENICNLNVVRCGQFHFVRTVCVVYNRGRLHLFISLQYQWGYKVLGTSIALEKPTLLLLQPQRTQNSQHRLRVPQSSLIVQRIVNYNKLVPVYLFLSNIIRLAGCAYFIIVLKCSCDNLFSACRDCVAQFCLHCCILLVILFHALVLK